VRAIDGQLLLKSSSRKKEIGWRRLFAQSERQWKRGSWRIKCS
jgi:hypothetical protein